MLGIFDFIWFKSMGETSLLDFSKMGMIDDILDRSQFLWIFGVTGQDELFRHHYKLHQSPKSTHVNIYVYRFE